jgi:hypothetical protein
MEFIIIKLGFGNMFAVDCVGKSGGLGLLWGDDAKVEVQNFSHRHINAIVNRPKRKFILEIRGVLWPPRGS